MLGMCLLAQVTATPLLIHFLANVLRKHWLVDQERDWVHATFVGNQDGVPDLRLLPE